MYLATGINQSELDVAPLQDAYCETPQAAAATAEKCGFKDTSKTWIEGYLYGDVNLNGERVISVGGVYFPWEESYLQWKKVISMGREYFQWEDGSFNYSITLGLHYKLQHYSTF